MTNEYFEKLKRFTPEPSSETAMTHDVLCLRHNVSVAKFIKSDALTRDEKEVFAEKLNDEWIKTVVDPYWESLYAFCEKYEIAPVSSNIGLEGMPMMIFLVKEMGEDFGGNPLSKLFDR